MSYLGMLTQDATYWPPETPDGQEVPVSCPVAIKCRWQDVAKRLVSSSGREYVSRAILYTAFQLQRDGWVVQGTTTLADPVDAGAARIQDVQRTQSPEGGLIVYKAVLG